MTPQEKKRLETVETLIAQLIKTDRYTVGRTLQFHDGRNVQTGLTTGTKIGTSTSQKLGFWNKTPVDQPADSGTASTVSDPPTQGEVNAIVTIVNNIRDRLRETGLMA